MSLADHETGHQRAFRRRCRDFPREEGERYYAAHQAPAEVRREVESLVTHDSGRPIVSVLQAAVGVAFREPVADGGSYGPFRLVREIGRAGWESCVSPSGWTGRWSKRRRVILWQ